MKRPITLFSNRHFAVELDHDRGMTGNHVVLRAYSQRWIRSIFVSYYRMDRPD